MIEFREETHEYFLDGRKLISVTQLMRKHGLAPSYDAVPSEVLKAKAERGTLIHKEIEQYIKHGEIGFTTEFANFIEYMRLWRDVGGASISILDSEAIVYNDIVAGTVDLTLLEDEIYTVADIKTTATLHKEAVSWQLSIYAYLIAGKSFEYPKKGQAFHFDKDGNLNVVDIPLKPFTEVERLFGCERRGEIYTQELTVSNTQLAELVEVESLIKQIEEQKKAAEAQAAELRAALMQAMEANGVTSFENENIKITYVAPTTRTAIDSAKLKKELPEIAEKYTKTSNVKASLRITLKEANNG